MLVLFLTFWWYAESRRKQTIRVQWSSSRWSSQKRRNCAFLKNINYKWFPWENKSRRILSAPAKATRVLNFFIEFYKILLKLQNSQEKRKTEKRYMNIRRDDNPAKYLFKWNLNGFVFQSFFPPQQRQKTTLRKKKSSSKRAKQSIMLFKFDHFLVSF